MARTITNVIIVVTVSMIKGTEDITTTHPNPTRGPQNTMDKS